MKYFLNEKKYKDIIFKINKNKIEKNVKNRNNVNFLHKKIIIKENYYKFNNKKLIKHTGYPGGLKIKQAKNIYRKNFLNFFKIFKKNLFKNKKKNNFKFKIINL